MQKWNKKRSLIRHAMQPIDFEYFHLNEQKIRTFPTIKSPHFDRKYICIGLFNTKQYGNHTYSAAYVPVACIWVSFRCIVLHVTSDVESHCWWMNSLFTVFPTFRGIHVLFVYTPISTAHDRELTSLFIHLSSSNLHCLIYRDVAYVVNILNLLHCIHSAVVLFHFNI